MKMNRIAIAAVAVLALASLGGPALAKTPTQNAPATSSTRILRREPGRRSGAERTLGHTKISRNSTNDTNPSVGPDGRIAFVRGGDIWVMAGDGTGALCGHLHDDPFGRVAHGAEHGFGSCLATAHRIGPERR